MIIVSTAPRPFRPGRGERKNPGAAVAAPGVEGPTAQSERRRLHSHSCGGVEAAWHSAGSYGLAWTAHVTRRWGPRLWRNQDSYLEFILLRV